MAHHITVISIQPALRDIQVLRAALVWYTLPPKKEGLVDDLLTSHQYSGAVLQPCDELKTCKGESQMNKFRVLILYLLQPG